MQPILIGINFQIKSIRFHHKSMYEDFAGMRYNIGQQSGNIIAHKAIGKNKHTLKLTDYAFLDKVLKHLSFKNLVKTPVRIVINNRLMAEIMNRWLPYWGEFGFPTGKYTIAQLKHIARYYHDNHVSLDIIPANFTAPKIYSVICNLFSLTNQFQNCKIDYVGYKQAIETLKLVKAMPEMIKSQR